MNRGILEREAELSALAGAVQAAASGDGSAVLINGEAGIGKSSLVDALRARLPAEGRMFVGYCDDLATPRTLGPFRDLVGSVGAEFSRAVTDGGDRDRVLAALRAELDWAEHPTVLAIEDIHWADDATLDALRYLIRRIADLPAVLVLTYRDDEADRAGALYSLLGEASRSSHVRHLALRRLSHEAVRQLSAGSPVAADNLFALTSGNPFFVGELLASAQGEHVPRTIVDAVMARVRQLDAPVQDVLEQLAVVPSTLERWLVDALVPDGPGGVAALAAAEQGGLLTVSARRISFRHELTRRAIMSSIPSARLIALNQRVLAALVERGGSDVSRIVHHAAQTGDEDAIVRYGPAAARDAARAGAHREALAHWGLVLEHADRFAAAERAELLEQYAIECYTSGAAEEEAVRAQQQAVELNHTQGDLRALGSSLRWLSRMCWWAGDRSGAEQAGREAVDVLERAADTRLLALALSNQSQLCMLAHRLPDSIAYGERAVALARQVNDAATISHALANIGTSKCSLGDPAGERTLDEALRVALGAGDVEDASRAYVNIVWVMLDWFRLDEAESYLMPGITLAEESEFLGFLSYMRLEQARIEFSRGRWDEAARLAEAGLDAQTPTRCTALTLLGRVLARRGHPDAASLLGQGWELAVKTDELQRTGPAAAARAEAAWLHGDQGAVHDIAAPVYEEAVRLGDQPHAAELGYWLAKTGHRVQPHSGHPYAVQAAGRWREAAALWEAAGCPYEHAAALAESPDPDHLLTALATLDELGAKPLAAYVRGRLRALGVARIPRGPLDETRVNPAGLTTRQIDVVRLLGKGYTNAEIASELVVSVRTVDSHVAAVLGKLGAASRREAAARAAELGVLDAGDR